MTAVWVYWAAGADGDELRYSIRSVVEHFRDLANVVICGDIPDWYTGDAIPSPRWNKADAIAHFGTGKWAKWTDSVLKLTRIAASDLVTDRFLWLYDDTFFVKPITAAEAAVPRVTRQLCADTDNKAGGTWREVLRRTTVALKAAGRPSLNYSHHAPMVYDKAKLFETLEVFEPFNQPRAIESLYANHHTDAADAVPIGRWLQYTKSPPNPFIVSPHASVVNVGGFRPQVEKVITARFPNPSPYETDPPDPSDPPPEPPAVALPIPKPAPRPTLPPAFTQFRRAA